MKIRKSKNQKIWKKSKKSEKSKNRKIEKIEKKNRNPGKSAKGLRFSMHPDFAMLCMEIKQPFDFCPLSFLASSGFFIFAFILNFCLCFEQDFRDF